jgi:predicted  nucleic acid-binding Zn-ribbon protein
MSGRMLVMPHKCTNCEHIFKDGAAKILDGCPHCGWNKFLYVPEKSETDDAPDTEAQVDEPEVVEKKSDLQVESIRILDKGSYELNLEALLDREEIIMSMKEDGRYIVHLPSVFDKSKKRR